MKLNKKVTSVEFDANIPSTHPDEILKDPTGYQRLVGRLLYLTSTRLDISFVVQCLSQFMHSPKTSHMEAAIRLVRYLKSEPGLGILMLSKGGNELKVLCDADWMHALLVGDQLQGTWYNIEVHLYLGNPTNR